jgi:ferrous iron transport protein B
MRLLLGIPVVETVGHRGRGVDDLVRAVLHAAAHPVRRKRVVLGAEMDAAVDAMLPHMRGASWPAHTRPWIATRLLLADARIEAEAVAQPGGEALVAEARRQQTRLRSVTGMDPSLFVTQRFYGFVDGLLSEVLVRSAREDARASSNAIDRILVHRFAGLPIFALAMFLLFYLTFRVGEYPAHWIAEGFSHLGRAVSSLWPQGSDSWLRSLLVDGVIGGVGGVVVFVPNILLLFLGLAILEDTGYMARSAFLMDRVMHKFGLHGGSFLPMLAGFGCSIPGIMATRTLENEKDRLATMFVLPLMSCGARLPIWMVLVPAYFPAAWRAPALWLIYAFGIATAFVVARLLRRTVLKGDDAPFVMELPPYRLPTMRSIVMKMLERSWLYLRKAGTVILGISAILWFLTAFPRPLPGAPVAAECVQVQDQEAALAACQENAALPGSYAGRFGQAVEPLFRPLGFDWKIVTGMVGAFAAKEVFVAQMGIVYSMQGNPDDPTTLSQAIAADYPPPVGAALIAFLLIGTPCMATLAVVRRESGSWKWATLQLVGLTALAYLVAMILYQVGSLLNL